MTVPADGVGFVTFKLNLTLSRFVTEQMSRLTDLPVYRRQESSVDQPHALARRLRAATVQDVLREYEAGTTSAELADRYGVSRTGLKNLLHSQGAAVRSPRGLSYRRQESGVDLPYALAKRLGVAVVQEIVGCYEAGATAAVLADRYGVSRTGITNLLDSQGAAVRRRCGLSPTDVDLAERLYAAGWLLREIGVELGFSRDAVRRALQRRGTVMRSGYGSANRSKRVQR